MKAYQLKIAINNSHPPIWRRCIIPAGITFSQLSIILNRIMDWSGYHLFEFEFYHLQLKISEDDGMDDFFGFYDFDALEASETYINEYLESEKWFTYTYDFGDNWRHRVTIEKVIENYDENYPQVLKCKGASPVEDCGGIYGYYECLEIINDPSHHEHKERSAWMKSQLYQETYEIAEVNADLKTNYFVKLGKGDTRVQYEIYDKCIWPGKGLTGSKVAKNVGMPVRSERHKKEDVFENMSRAFEGFFGGADASIAEYYAPQVYLSDVLGSYEKDELLEFAGDFELKNVAKLSKKKLLEKVVDVMLQEEMITKIFSVLTDEEIEAFEQTIELSPGYRPDEETETLLRSI